MESIQQECELPPEIWHCVFLYLPVLLRFRIVSVCREWGEGNTMHRTVMSLKSQESVLLDDTILGRMVNMVSLEVSGTPYVGKERISGKGFQTHWNLASLSLDCAYRILDSDISRLPSLTSLSLRDMMHIKDEAIKGLTSLQSLRLGVCVNGITDEGIRHLTGLTTLYASDQRRRITEKSINALTALKSLYLRHERIQDLFPLIKTNAVIYPVYGDGHNGDRPEDRRPHVFGARNPFQ